MSLYYNGCAISINLDCFFDLNQQSHTRASLWRTHGHARRLLTCASPPLPAPGATPTPRLTGPEPRGAAPEPAPGAPNGSDLAVRLTAPPAGCHLRVHPPTRHTASQRPPARLTRVRRTPTTPPWPQTPQQRLIGAGGGRNAGQLPYTCRRTHTSRGEARCWDKVVRWAKVGKTHLTCRPAPSEVRCRDGGTCREGGVGNGRHQARHRVASWR